jgi:hypothetical protein
MARNTDLRHSGRHGDPARGMATPISAGAMARTTAGPTARTPFRFRGQVQEPMLRPWDAPGHACQEATPTPVRVVPAGGGAPTGFCPEKILGKIWQEGLSPVPITL